MRSPDYLIIKAHGTIDDTDHIVFTHSQYSRIRNSYATFYRMLDSLLLTHTFIFLGCGLSDPDIQLVLENLNFSFPGCRPHYMIIPSNNLSEDELSCIASNRNLEFLTYDNPDGMHSQLLENLRCLGKEVDEVTTQKAKTKACVRRGTETRTKETRWAPSLIPHRFLGKRIYQMPYHLHSFST